MTYLELFEKYYDKDLSFKERITFAKEYSDFFYELNKKSKRNSEFMCKYFKVKTIIKAFLMKKTYKNINNERIDYFKSQKELKNSHELLEQQSTQWIIDNKDLLLEKYDKAYEYLKSFVKK